MNIAFHAGFVIKWCQAFVICAGVGTDDGYFIHCINLTCWNLLSKFTMNIHTSLQNQNNMKKNDIFIGWFCEKNNYSLKINLKLLNNTLNIIF